MDQGSSGKLIETLKNGHSLHPEPSNGFPASHISLVPISPSPQHYAVSYTVRPGINPPSREPGFQEKKGVYFMGIICFIPDFPQRNHLSSTPAINVHINVLKIKCSSKPVNPLKIGVIFYFSFSLQVYCSFSCSARGFSFRLMGAFSSDSIFARETVPVISPSVIVSRTVEGTMTRVAFSFSPS